MYTENEIGNIIKQLRGEMSLREFAKKCNVSHTTIDTLEKGFDFRTKKPAQAKLTTLQKIADACGVSLSYITGDSSKDIRENELKVALFGGDTIVTDKMWNEVKTFADYIKIKYRKLTGENMMKIASRLREAMAAKVIEIKEKASKEEAAKKYGAIYWAQESKKFGSEITSDRITKLLDAQVSPTYDEVHIFHKMLDVPEEWLIGIDPKAPEKIIQLRLSRLGKIEDGKITLLGVADASPKTRETFDGMDEETFDAKLYNAEEDPTDII